MGILATLQPRITSAVQSAVGQTSTVNSVISSLSPRISSAVSSALAGSNRRTSSSRRAQYGASRGFQGSGSSRGNLGGLFGVSGQSSVSVQTPEFAIEY